MANKEKLEPRIKTSEQKVTIYIPRHNGYTYFKTRIAELRRQLRGDNND